MSDKTSLSPEIIEEVRQMDLSAFTPFDPPPTGRYVTLECQGHPEGEHYLEGHPEASCVMLAPLDQGDHAGKVWELYFENLERGLAMFKCMGMRDGDRWLEGSTQSGDVRLASASRTSDSSLSGTVWRMMRDPGGQWYLECQGHPEGVRFLKGDTASLEVKLAPSTSQDLSGTRWIIRTIHS